MSQTNAKAEIYIKHNTLPFKESDLTIVSINVRGLSNRNKRIDVLNYIKKFDFSICCLQDFHCIEKDVHKYEIEWGNEVMFSCHTGNSRGVAILFNRKLEYKIHDTYKDLEGNIIIIDIEVYEHRFTLCTLYGPNRDDPEFYIKIKDKITEYHNQSTIIVGDWNLVLNQNLDTKHYR